MKSKERIAWTSFLLLSLVLTVLLAPNPNANAVLASNAKEERTTISQIPTQNGGDYSRQVVGESARETLHIRGENPDQTTSRPYKNLGGDSKNASLSIRNYIIEQSKIYGVDETQALFIVEHESKFNPQAIGDDGQSIGLWQISKKWHPEVGEKCSTDFRCSTLWSIKRIKQGYINEWSAWRLRCKLYKKCE